MSAPSLVILAIDDSVDNLTSLKALVAEAFPGAAVLTAASGRQGIDVAIAADPDVLLLDVVMPGMDGFEVCRRLKADPRTRDIPVLFLTALRGDRESRVKGLEVGAEAFLSKPIDELELHAQIRAMARIKAASVRKKDETRRLEALVAERTRALEQSEARYRTLILNAPEAIAVVEGGAVVLANHACARLFGAESAAGLVGRRALDLVDPGFREEATTAARRFEERREPLPRTEGKIARLDGAAVDVEVMAVPLAEGGFTGAHVVLRDVSERKRAEAERAFLEEQLRAAQKMEAIGRLAGGVAHDFNNLLSVILGNVDFAIEQVAEGTSLRGDLGEIRDAAQRAASLTHQLLAFSRKQLLEPKVLDLNQVVRGLERMLPRLIGEDIDLTHALAPDLGHVKADLGQIEQVVVNLAVNARDAMPDGGRLLVRTANVDLDARRCARLDGLTAGPHVLLEIRDTGSGMDAATAQRVFEPFFTTKEKGKGTGLGLSTVYGIVKQSRGDIVVQSELGRGTAIAIYLPRHDDTPPPPRVVLQVEARAHGTETILVVEDEAALRKVTARALEAKGFRVLVAASGAEAMPLVERHEGEIDLLLTDVIMPGMSGPAVAEQVRLVRPAIRVLYMSGYTDDAVAGHGVLRADIRLLRKPFAHTDLVRTVREVLDEPAP